MVLAYVRRLCRYVQPQTVEGYTKRNNYNQLRQVFRKLDNGANRQEQHMDRLEDREDQDRLEGHLEGRLENREVRLGSRFRAIHFRRNRHQNRRDQCQVVRRESLGLR